MSTRNATADAMLKTDMSINDPRAPLLLGLGTAVPPVVLRQSRVRELLLGQQGLSRLEARLIAAAIDGSGVDTRHTVIGDFDEAAQAPAEPRFYDRATGQLVQSPTSVRNGVYAREAAPLALAAAQAALADAGVDAASVTDLITVSCTGLIAPGVDQALVRALGLRADTRRLHLGFVGCHGAFPGLRAAVDALTADPARIALLVCVELCTLHLRVPDDADAAIVASLFSDGAGAAVLAGHAALGAARPRSHPRLRVDGQHTLLSDDGADDMTWAVGDNGFTMRLSSYVPKLLEAEIGAAIEPLRPGDGPWRDVEHWAVHPGGRAILDRVAEALELDDEQLAPSRAVLREHGNMSSPTVLFVLDRILHGAVAPGERVLATAFGPGITIESALFTAVPGDRDEPALGVEG